MIVIKDNGIGFGIFEDNIKDILNPYFTTKIKGTGLGLSIVNKIINDHNGSIDFIKIFAEIIDIRVQESYNSLDIKPRRIPEKIKKLILIRLDLCLPYREAIRSSLSLMALPKNSKQSLKILYTTCNYMWRLAGDKSTDFSFYTKRLSLSSIYASTLLFWLNDTSFKQEETEYFLDRRLKDVSMISKLKKPLNIFQNISTNINVENDSLGIKSIFNIIKSLNKIKKTPFNNPFWFSREINYAY